MNNIDLMAGLIAVTPVQTTGQVSTPAAEDFGTVFKAHLKGVSPNAANADITDPAEAVPVEAILSDSASTENAGSTLKMPILIDDEIMMIEESKDGFTITDESGNSEFITKESLLSQLILSMAQLQQKPEVNDGNEEDTNKSIELLSKLQSIVESGISLNDEQIGDLRDVLKSIGDGAGAGAADGEKATDLLSMIIKILDGGATEDGVSVAGAMQTADVDAGVDTVFNQPVTKVDAMPEQSPIKQLPPQTEAVAKIAADIDTEKPEEKPDAPLRENGTNEKLTRITPELLNEIIKRVKAEPAKNEVPTIQDLLNKPKEPSSKTAEKESAVTDALKNAKLTRTEGSSESKPEVAVKNEEKPLDTKPLFNVKKEGDSVFDNVLKESSEQVKIADSKDGSPKAQVYDLKEPKDISKLIRTLESSATKGETKLTVSLTPENLGRLEIRLAEVGGKITAQFITDNETSHKMIIAHSESIRNQLAEKGIVIDNLQFGFADTSSKQESGEGKRAAKNNGNKKMIRDSADGNEIGKEFATVSNKAIYA